MIESCRCRMAYRGHVRGCGTNRIGALIYTDPEIYPPCCLECILAGMGVDFDNLWIMKLNSRGAILSNDHLVSLLSFLSWM